MSKESFSKRASQSIYKHIDALTHIDIDSFLEKDEYFELILCLAYMTLSREYIIEKDIKNKDKLSRLTQKVDTLEIDKVFSPGFAKEMPNIIYAKEFNNVWILDNIRDSIMHGAIDIDEERKCFLINNNQYDRELIAEIPFSWFIAYAKNDILSKKLADAYTIKGFYYNKNKKDKSYLVTKKELTNNILYNIDIRGNKFNIKEIESRIKTLLDAYSKEEITNEEVEKYRLKINKERIKYNEKYLVSFYLASEKIKDIIEKEFPGTNIRIYINNRKYRFINKHTKKLPQYYTNYDIMLNTFNTIVSPKAMSLLKYISNLIENIDMNIKEDKLNEEEKNTYKLNIKLFHKLLNGEYAEYKKKENTTIIYQEDVKILKSICINILGLSSLVINNGLLYDEKFLKTNPYEYNITAYKSNPYLEYANKRKSIIMDILDSEIRLFSARDQYSKCPNEQAKKIIENNINSLTITINNKEKELSKLKETKNYKEYIDFKKMNYRKKEKLHSVIDRYFDHFYAAKTVEGKQKIKKVISTLIDEDIKEGSIYTYGYCNNMQEVLTIIRNCFSHIGRISLSKNYGYNDTIILTDYDSSNTLSGVVVCKYTDLLDLLRIPFISKEDNNLIKKKTL